MNEQLLSNVEQVIDLQVSKVEKILDKRASVGHDMDDFLTEERGKLYGMLQIYWLLGGDKYQNFKR